MVLAYVLITTTPNKEKDVYDKLTSYKHVIEAYRVLQECDLIAKIECRDMQHIGDFIMNKIRCIEHVIETRTLVAGKF